MADQRVTRVVKTRMRHDGRRHRPGDTVELTPAQAAHHEARGHVVGPSPEGATVAERKTKAEPVPRETKSGGKSAGT